MATEYTASALVLLGVSFLFVWIAFKLERKLEADSVFDFFDTIRLLFFSVGLLFALMALNFGNAVVANDTTDMASIFDTTVVLYTFTVFLLVVFGFVYVFVIIPRLIKKLSIKRRKEEDEAIG